MIAARLGYKEIFRKITVQKFGITENSDMKFSSQYRKYHKHLRIKNEFWTSGECLTKIRLLEKNVLNLQLNNFIPGCNCDRLWVSSLFPQH